MKYITKGAEQLACQYIKNYRENTISCHAAILSLADTGHTDIGKRALIKQYFHSELKDNKAVIFQFINGDLLVLSKNLNNHILFRVCRHFGLERNEDHKLYKLPHKHAELAERLVGYMQSYRRYALAQHDLNKGATTPIRDKFFELNVCDKLQKVMHKVRGDRASLSILVIDDDNFATHLVKKTLGKVHEVTTANTAIDGLKKYARLAPDIIFLDINMPAISGHDFLKKIFDLDPHAFVVMLSGHSDRSNKTKAKQLGAKGFIGKPFSREDIYGYINECQGVGEIRFQ